MKCQPKLIQVVGTTHPSCGFSDLLNSRKKKPNQNRDDRNYDKQFDQRKSRPTIRVNHRAKPP
jgi:hypothetical protein